MKLRSCHIDNFGKLSDLHLEFQDGVNLFHEPNAWGKSTLAAFLRVMFYGFDSKRESGLFDKERVVFRPWQGGTYGGELDFSYQGKEYRISRTFGKTEKTDVFHLYDLSTNLECHDFSSEIGSEIFGLDSASFKRSAFIAQNDCECCSTDAINAKLGNLVENTNDINNFETAQKKIHDRMNKLSPDRATGSMKKRTNMITLLTEELRGYDAAEASYKKITEKLTEKQEQRKELAGIRDQYAKALQVASEESRREGIKQAYAAILQEEQEKKEALDAFADVFPGQVPQDEEFAKQNQDVQMLGVLKTTLFNLGLTEEEEAILFSKQTGVSTPLTAGAELRAALVGKDAESIAFLNATESTGLQLGLDNYRAPWKIICIRTAFKEYKTYGADLYKEALTMLARGWEGDPDSLRSGILRGMVRFVALYQGEYDPERLVKRLHTVHPMTLVRDEKSLSGTVSYKYMMLILRTYNGSSRRFNLPIKQ